MAGPGRKKPKTRAKDGRRNNNVGDTMSGRKHNRKLTTRQRDFILAYMANGHNATQAALKAGYSPQYADVVGWQLVHVTKGVAEEITRLTELAAKKCAINATYVLGSLKDIADACKVKKTEVNQDGQVVEKGGVVDSAGANRALELLGKNLKLFTESLDITRRSELADLTDEELLKVIKNSTSNNK